MNLLEFGISGGHAVKLINLMLPGR
jgi:hypothetical protein